MRLAAGCFALCLVLSAQVRSRKAHAHGSAKVSIAFETVNGAPRGVAEFEAPAESVAGFEHEAKSAADKARVAAALQTLKARFGEMVIFPAASACVMMNRAAKIERAGDHAEVRAAFDVACAKPLAGGEIRFGFAKVFPGIREVDVAVLAGEQQMSADVKNDRGVIKIGR
jgi:hypothetical protein